MRERGPAAVRRERHGHAHERGQPTTGPKRLARVVSTVLLALATVATAWAGYQASRWHGEQAQAQTRATAARLESTRASGVANREVEIDVAVFIQWVDAHAQGEAELEGLLRGAFFRQVQAGVRRVERHDAVRERRRAGDAVRDARVQARRDRPRSSAWRRTRSRPRRRRERTSSARTGTFSAWFSSPPRCSSRASARRLRTRTAEAAILGARVRAVPGNPGLARNLPC